MLNSSEFNLWLRQPLTVRRPLIMGVLNVTPDSFSDGGRFQAPPAAADFSAQMISAGADWIDIGGESTRPGSQPVSGEEQIRRVLPALKLIRSATNAVISVDTTSSQVAQAALDAGADCINDVSAGRNDSQMFSLAAGRGAAIILMHMQGTPATMQDHPTYRDVTAEVAQFLIGRKDMAVKAGISSDRILLDPGIGFGKTVSHNLQLLRDTLVLANLGSPLVVGPSRKSFIAKITGETRPEERVFATAGAIAWCVANRAGVVRVHDVGPIAQVIKMISAIIGSENTDS